jgi:CheY-like chemotaxis protein
VLADDDVLLREGLASLLDRCGFDVVGQAGNGVELLAQVRAARPELAIIDIRMPPGHGTEGLQAARVIRAELPGTAIIVLSAHVEVEEAMELLAGGEGHRLPAQEPGHRRDGAGDRPDPRPHPVNCGRPWRKSPELCDDGSPSRT